MSFKLSVDKAKTLLDFASVIAVVADEATLNLTPDGITIREMDQSRVAMINLEYPKTMFNTYDCAAPIKFGVNITELTRLLKRAEADDTVSLTNIGDGKLNLTFTGKRNRVCRLPILEATNEDAPAPTINFTTKAKLNTNGLIQSIEDAQICDDHVFISSDENQLILDAKGDLLDIHIVLAKGSEALLDIDVKEPTKSCYSLSYLVEITKAATALSEIVSLEYSQDMPVKLDFILQQGKAEFYLAPRVQDA